MSSLSSFNYFSRFLHQKISWLQRALVTHFLASLVRQIFLDAGLKMSHILVYRFFNQPPHPLLLASAAAAEEGWIVGTGLSCQEYHRRHLRPHVMKMQKPNLNAPKKASLSSSVSFSWLGSHTFKLGLVEAFSLKLGAHWLRVVEDN